MHLRLFSVLSLVAAATGIVYGQTDIPDPVRERQLAGGLHLDSASFSSGYSSPGGALGSGLGGVGSGAFAWASLGIRYTRTGPSGSLEIHYTPSYSGAFQYAKAQSFNQMMTIDAARRLSDRWSLYLGATGDDSTIEEILFRASPLEKLNAGATSLDSFAQSVRSGAVSPITAQAAFYGRRILSLGGNAAFSYRYSPRLRFSFRGNMWQSQSRGDNRQDVNNTSALVGRTRSEQGGAAISYSLTPRTEVGSDTAVILVHGFRGDYLSSSESGTFSRRLTEHWFTSESAGVGRFTPLARANASGGLSFIGGALIGYKSRSHTWTGGYSMQAGDAYGFGSSSTGAYIGSWAWKRPGSAWGFTATGERQFLKGGNASKAGSWQGSTELTRLLGLRWAVGLSYAYLSASFVQAGLHPDATVHAARLMITRLGAKPATPDRTGPTAGGGE